RSAQAERLASLGLLSSGFAHEVRNPLNGLLNAIKPLREQIDRGGSSAEAETLINIMQESGERVRQLAESLLELARTASGPELVDIQASLESTLRVFAWRMPPGIEVRKEFECHERLWGDPPALNTMWLNLLDNAVRAMGEKGVLTIRTERRGSSLLVSISDSGRGIAPEIYPRLFEPFVSSRPAGEGSGLGLVLCRRVVLQHKGTIRVDSTPNIGTRVLVALP